ncbi:MAG TPA: hypothetical protein VNN55_10435 [bacterium]|nr:hypothetical protein [bacterium]
MFVTAGGTRVTLNPPSADEASIRTTITITRPWDGAWQIGPSDEQITIHAPWVQTRWRDSLRVYSSYMGGQIRDWPAAPAFHSSAAWPGFAYTPTIAAYDQASGSGIGLTAFSARLRQIEPIAWTDGNGVVGLFVRITPRLDRGESDTVALELRRFASGMPDEFFASYRKRFLLPWAKKLGIDEASCDASGVWVHDGWPGLVGANGLTSYQPGNLIRIAEMCRARGAGGLVIWSTGERTAPGAMYENDHREYPWFAEYAEASKIFDGRFGCLIAPQAIMRPNAPREYIPGVDDAPTNLRAGAARRAVTQLRDDLRAAGVRFAYWDAAQNPADQHGRWWVEPFDWLGLMMEWREAGITVFPETSSDVAVFASGATLFYPANPPLGDMRIPRIVTPRGRIFLMSPMENDAWRDDALRRGFVPFIWRENFLR